MKRYNKEPKPRLEPLDRPRGLVYRDGERASHGHAGLNDHHRALARAPHSGHGKLAAVQLKGVLDGLDGHECSVEHLGARAENKQVRTS